MELDRAREMLSTQTSLGSGYNRNAARMAPGEVMRDHGQDAVDHLIRDYGLEQKWAIKPGTHFDIEFK